MSRAGIYLYVNLDKQAVEVVCFPDPHLDKSGWCVAQLINGVLEVPAVGSHSNRYVSRSESVWTYLGPLSKFGIEGTPRRSMDEVFVTVCALFFDEPNVVAIDEFLDGTEPAPGYWVYRHDWLDALSDDELRKFLLHEYNRALEQLKKGGLGYEEPLSE